MYPFFLSFALTLSRRFLHLYIFYPAGETNNATTSATSTSLSTPKIIYSVFSFFSFVRETGIFLLLVFSPACFIVVVLALFCREDTVKLKFPLLCTYLVPGESRVVADNSGLLKPRLRIARKNVLTKFTIIGRLFEAEHVFSLFVVYLTNPSVSQLEWYVFMYVCMYCVYECIVCMFVMWDKIHPALALQSQTSIVLSVECTN